MVRRMMVMAICLVVAVVLSCVLPRPSVAGSSLEKEKKEETKEKKQKKEKKEKKDAESNSKAKGSSNPVDGVNKMFDGFKKNQGGIKDDAEKSKGSVNDFWQKSK